MIFLVSALHRAVASVQGDCVTVLVSYDLNLQMPGVGRQLLDEHGRAGHLCLNLNEARTELLHVRHHTDSLAAASLRSLNHQREPNLLGALFRLGQVPERRREQHILGIEMSGTVRPEPDQGITFTSHDCARIFAQILSPTASIDSADGPRKAMSWYASAAGSFGFSEACPHPGQTASAWHLRATLTIRSTLA